VVKRVEPDEIEQGADQRLAAVQPDRQVAFSGPPTDRHQQPDAVAVEELHPVKVKHEFAVCQLTASSTASRIGSADADAGSGTASGRVDAGRMSS